MRTVAPAIACLALIGVGAVIAGLLFALTANQRPEYLVLSGPEYGNSRSWLAVGINNAGEDAVVLVKVFVNGAEQLSTNPILPTSVAPGHGLILNVTMKLDQSPTYQIDLFTLQGNRFSKSIQMPSGVIMYKAYVIFFGLGSSKRISVTIGNSGTSDTQITQIYVGTSTATLQKQAIAPRILPADGIQTFMFNYDWTAGTTYYFKVISYSGQSLDWPEQAPVDS